MSKPRRTLVALTLVAALVVAAVSAAGVCSGWAAVPYVALEACECGFGPVAVVCDCPPAPGFGNGTSLVVRFRAPTPAPVRPAP